MANILGIDYYRVVSETGEGEWSQVYVKTAFDKEELGRFGSIFGVVKLSGKGDLVTKGMNLIGEIDKWCEEASHKGDVAGLLALLTKKLATGAFVWIYMDDSGGRRIKTGALPGNGVAIVRGGQRVWLFENGDGRVVTGEVKDRDKVFFGSKEAVDLIDTEQGETKEAEELTEKVTAEMMKLSAGARAALILLIKPMTQEIEKEEVVPEVKLEDKIKEAVLQKIEERQGETLVSDRVVGATGVAGKIAEAKMSWKDFVTNWQTAKSLRSDESVQKRHRLFLFIGAVFLVVLGVSVGLGLIKARKDRAEAVFAAVYEPLEKKRSDAEALYNLNPVGARDLLRSVKQDLATQKGQFAKTPYEGRMTDLEKAVEQSWVKVSGDQKSNLDLFFNLGLVRDQMKGDRLTFTGKDFLVLDSTSGVVARISYPDKKQEVILGKGEGQNWLDVAGYNGNNVLLTKTGMTAILSGTRSDQKFDAAVVEPIAVDVFPGAAYVLDKGASEIWRFGLSGGLINERRRWWLPGVEADVRGATDMAIDTDIWVGLSNGKILRFRRGQFEKFNLSDVPENFSVKRLAVSNDVALVAVLDSDKERIVLFNKDTGAYVKQIMADGLAEATDLVWVSDHELMILSGDKLLMTSI